MSSFRSFATLHRRCFSIHLRGFSAASVRATNNLPTNDSGGASSGWRSKIDLPPASEWPAIFPSRNPFIRDRVSVQNPATAAALANAFVPAGEPDGKIVIEAFPGPGLLTRALLQLPKNRIQKLIVLEDYGDYLEWLKPLQEMDSRVHIVPLNGHLWSTYVTIESLGLLDDVKTTTWDGGVHPQLQFISHLPQTVYGEQLIAQLLRSIPLKSWLFKYGRVPMSFVVGDWVWQRISPRKYITRCKLSLIAQLVSQFELALPPTALQPYKDHFHPHRIREENAESRLKRHAGSPCQAVNIVPLERQVIEAEMLDKWDFCLRRLFVLKSKPLKNAIPHLCPGSRILLKAVTNPDLPDNKRIDVRKIVRDMTIEDWVVLVNAFDQWPFAPEDLAITDTLNEDRRS